MISTIVSCATIGLFALPAAAQITVLLDEDFAAGSAAGLTWTSAAVGVSNGQQWIFSGQDGTTVTATEMWTGSAGATARGLTTTYNHDQNADTPNITIPGGFEVMSAFSSDGFPDTIQVAVRVVLPASLDADANGLLTFFTENRISGSSGGNAPRYSIFNITDNRAIIAPAAPAQPTGDWNFQSIPVDFIAADAGDTIEIRFHESITSGSGGGARGLQVADVTFSVPTAAFVHWDGLTTGGTHGASDIWDTTSGNWNNLAGYTGTVGPWAGGSAVFGGTGGTVTLGAPVSVGSITVNSGGYQIAAGTLTFAGTTPTIVANQGFEISSALGGNAVISKTGGSQLTLSGDGSGFTGVIDNKAGSTTLASSNWSGASFDASAGSLEVNPLGKVTINNLEAGSGSVSLQTGTTLDVGGTIQFTNGLAGLITGAGTLTSSSSPLGINSGTVNNGGLATSSQRIDAIVADDGVTPLALVKNNNNSLSFSKANTYTGGTTINGGRVEFTGTGNLGSGDVTINSGGQIFFATSLANNFFINGNGASEGAGVLGALRFSNSSISGDVTVATAARMAAYNAESGAISGDLLGSAPLEINAAATALANGIISLTGSGSAYTGTVTVSRGRFNTGASLGGNIVVADTGTLGAQGAIAGTVTLGTTGGATLVINPANPPSAANLTLNGATNVVFSASPVPGTPITLFNYSGTVTDSGTPPDLGDNFNFPGTGYRMKTFSNNTVGMAVELNLGTTADTWTGAGDATWRIGGASGNWSNISDGLFFNGDSVLFNDSAISRNVAVSASNGVPEPSSVTFANTTGNDYLVTGDAIGGGTALTKNGNGLVILTNSNTYTGGTVVNAGVLRIGNGGATGSVAGAVAVNAPGTVEYFRTTPPFGIGTVSGDGALVFRGTGASLEGDYDFVSSNIGFTGTVTIEKARLRVDASDLDSVTAPITILSGGQAYFIGGTHTDDCHISGIGWNEPSGFLGAIRFENGAILTGDIVLQGNSRLHTHSGATGGRHTGQISGPFNLEKSGTSTLVLDPAAPNTYGSTTVTAGNLVAGDIGANAFSTGPLTVNGGSLRLNGWDFSFASLSGTGGSVGNYYGSLPSVLTVGSDNTSTSYAGTLVNGAAGILSLVKTGTGTLLLNGASTYTGTTQVNAGAIGGSGSLTSAVTVAAAAGLSPGATAGAAGTFTIAGGLDISAAAAGPGILSFDLGPVAASDRIAVSGNLAIGTGSLGFGDFAFSAIPGLQNGTYTLISSTALSGTLDGADLTGSIGTASGTLQVTGNNVELVVTGASTPYEIYESANNIAGAGADVDSYGDGLANGIEFVLGGVSDPAVGSNDLDLLPTLTDNGATVSFSFTLTDGAAAFSPDIWSVEFDEDLIGLWTTAVHPGNSTIVITPDGVDPVSNVTVTIAKPLGGKLFTRLRVMIP